MIMDKFTQEAGSVIVDRLILAIQENKQYLSDIDGAIGDGDHGINMNKGFTLCREALDKQPGDFTYGLKTLGKILMMKIGGSMGPLYGKFFLSIGKALDGVAEIGRDEFGQALKAASTPSTPFPPHRLVTRLSWTSSYLRTRHTARP